MYSQAREATCGAAVLGAWNTRAFLEILCNGCASDSIRRVAALAMTRGLQGAVLWQCMRQHVGETDVPS